ncbi:MAG: TonB-dependent receptor, partial [Pseudomonadota bacterium]|nr:TonB-dependent receptor [Pseudomonadota bacterium]
EQFLRERNNSTVDIRLLSSENGRIFNNTTDWVVGIYQNNQDEDATTNYINLDYDAVYPTDSEFSTRNQALYSQLDYHATKQLSYTLGLRAESYQSDYQDSNNQENDFDETLFGGKLGVAYAYNASQKAYASLAKSFKTGGINNDTNIPESSRNFDTEYLWNLETGLKSNLLNGDLKTRLALFYSKRVNPQVSASYQYLDEDDNRKFAIYNRNIDEGFNYGLEAEADWSVNNDWSLLGSLGLLQSGLDEYEYTDKYSEITYLIKDGRDQAHAPNYQFTVGAEHYLTNNWVLSANLEGKDGFYFSDSHNAKSSAYTLVNASAEFSDKNLTVTFWARNLLDREYDVRGFMFGNNPSDGYTPTNYTQKGEPRTVGITARYNF